MDRDPSGFDSETVEQPRPAVQRPSLLRPSPELVWQGAQGTRSLRFTGSAVVGSSRDVDVQLDDPAVSRLHAELELRGNEVWVRDLGSTNGTYVEGVRVGSARVPERGELRVGSTRLTLRYAAEVTAVELWPQDSFGPLRGTSAVMRELFSMLNRMARTDSSVLIQGETGTGKEVVARALHEASARAAAPFLVVDCGAIPESLFESELFGSVAGAFTGAKVDRPGVIEEAEGGTVFFDEIGELPLGVQPKLLRVLETRTVRRVGESHYRPVDVRFLAATHRDLRTRVNQGAFREDLFFRLAVLLITVPPLRERLEDLPLLARSFLPDDRRGLLHAELLRDLTARPWLGNVRELRNFVQRAVALGADAAMELAEQEGSQRTGGYASLALDEPFKRARELCLEDFEKRYIRHALARHKGSVSNAAREAGVDRTYLYRLIQKHGL